jgi:hypothetical protein
MSTPSEYAKVGRDGETIAARLDQILDIATFALGREFRVTQGSYTGSVDQSGGTHDGGGAVDISVLNPELSTAERNDLVLVLRELGCAAWLRSPAQGDWPYHIHAIDSGATDASGQAKGQVTDYNNGRNGLASNGPDDGPEGSPRPLVPYNYAEDGMVEVTLAQKSINAIAKAVVEQAVPPTQFVKDVYKQLKKPPPEPRDVGDLLYNNAARSERMETLGVPQKGPTPD